MSLAKELLESMNKARLLEGDLSSLFSGSAINEVSRGEANKALQISLEDFSNSFNRGMSRKDILSNAIQYLEDEGLPYKTALSFSEKIGKLFDYFTKEGVKKVDYKEVINTLKKLKGLKEGFDEGKISVDSLDSDIEVLSNFLKKEKFMSDASKKLAKEIMNDLSSASSKATKLSMLMRDSI